MRTFYSFYYILKIVEQCFVPWRACYQEGKYGIVHGIRNIFGLLSNKEVERHFSTIIEKLQKRLKNRAFTLQLLCHLRVTPASCLEQQEYPSMSATSGLF